jgi:hypothetical protein
MKKNVVLIAAFAAFAVAACSQGPGESTGTERSSDGSQALTVVQNCQQEAETCAQSATTPSAISTCQQELRACLSALCSDAGLPPIPPIPPVPPVAFDAGAVVPPIDFDAAIPPVQIPPLPDAAVPPVVVPPVTFDAGLAGVTACIQALDACLQSSTDPATCATQVVTCLQHAI